MRSFALALVAGIAAAVPQYGSEGDYGYGGYPEAPASTTVVAEYSTPAYPEYTSEVPYPEYSTPAYPEYPEESSVAYSSYEETKTVEVPSYPTYTPESSVEVPHVPETSAVVYPTSSVEYPVESPCPSSTVTVTVTVPSGGEHPYTSKAVVPPYPTGTGVPTTKVYPTGTGVPSSYPSPPTFTGAASHANAGLFVAGAGAFAAFFL